MDVNDAAVPAGADTETPQGDTDAGSQNPPDETPDQAAQTDWAKEARKWEARAKKDAKALAAMKAQVQGLVSPETVKSAEAELTTARGEAEAAKAEALRYRVALQAGLPLDLARRLVGEDEEALVADAEALSKMLVPKKGTPDAKAGTAPSKNEQPKMSADDALRTALGFAPRS